MVHQAGSLTNVNQLLSQVQVELLEQLIFITIFLAACQRCCLMSCQKLLQLGSDHFKVVTLLNLTRICIMVSIETNTI